MLNALVHAVTPVKSRFSLCTVHGNRLFDGLDKVMTPFTTTEWYMLQEILGFNNMALSNKLHS